MNIVSMDMKIKQVNLDSAILFMQQEHATTLKGLHSEIENLQKRCSELTFQVAMSNTSISQEEELREKCSSLEQSLNIAEEKLQRSHTEIDQKDKRVNFLEQKVKSQERKILDLKESHKQSIQGLKSELNAKSDTIALLNSKYHQQRLLISEKDKSNADVLKLQESRLNSVSSSQEDTSPRVHHPVPPTEGSARCTRRRNSTDAEKCIVPTPPTMPAVKLRHSRRLPMKPCTPENIPDPTPFLENDKQRPQFSKRERAVLPPINTLSEATSRPSDFAFIKKGCQNVETLGDTSPDVETLAMSPITRGEHCLRSTRNYHKTD